MDINLIKVIVFATLLFAIVKLQRHNAIHRIVLIILVVDFLTELIDTLLISVFELPYRRVVLLNIIIQYCLWLWLLGAITHKKKALKYSILLFLSFAVINFLFIQGTDTFNYYTFIFGALLYITSFFGTSFEQLNKENFEFIFSNNYLLITAPILFFLGMSLMFAFVSREITQTLVFGNLKLYTIVSNYVNILCYALMCIYIKKEVKVVNE